MQNHDEKHLFNILVLHLAISRRHTSTIFTGLIRTDLVKKQHETYI